jgi:hypothetical protein
MAMTRCMIDHLPDEVLIKIFEETDAKSALSCMVVCSRLNLKFE